MAKSKRRPASAVPQQARSEDRPGSEGTADIPPPSPKAKRRRRTWEFAMVLEEPPLEFCDHPLSGMSPEERDAARVKALGQVLAKIALRKARQPSVKDASETNKAGPSHLER